MKIYISGSMKDQEHLRQEAHRLWFAGHEITSSWLNETIEPIGIMWRGVAITDIAEVYKADCIIMDNNGASSTGGRYVEWGLALAPGANKIKILVAHDKPVKAFLTLADHICVTWQDVHNLLESHYAVHKA